MIEGDLGEVGAGDVVFGRKNENGLIVLVLGVGNGRIFGRVVNGQYPVVFDAATGLEAVERRTLPEAPADVNPFYTAFMSGFWAEGMHIVSAARLPDDLVDGIKRLDALMSKASYGECLELMKEHGAVIGDAIRMFGTAAEVDPAPGMR